MTNEKDSINAVVEHVDGNTMRLQCIDYGLTKLEYFAAMAMQGLLAGHYEYFTGNADVSIPSMISEYAVLNAQALIAELNKL